MRQEQQVAPSLNRLLFCLFWFCSACFGSEKITAVMITGMLPARHPMAELAVQSFFAQTYPNKNLLIINHGEGRFAPHPLIAEIKVPRESILGQMRNYALDALEEGAVWVQWYDDDWHHPSAIEEQYKVLIERKADLCCLSRQIQYAFAIDAAWEMKGPLHGTVMERKIKKIRYPEQQRAEYTALYKQYCNEANVVRWVNPAYYYIRFIHGKNTWNAAHFQLGTKTNGLWNLSKENFDYLSAILPLYRGLAP